MPFEENKHEPTRIMLAQHRILDCLGLASLFRASTRLQLISASESLQKFVDLCSEHHPDVAILDVRFPSDTAFDAAINLINNNYVKSVLFLDDEVCFTRANKALGIPHSGYFAKSASLNEIQDAIDKLKSGEVAFDRLLQRNTQLGANDPKRPQRFSLPLFKKLTKREMEVMTLLAQGLPVRRVAIELSLAESTVDNHKSRLTKKLDVHKAIELTLIAMRHGLID